MTGDKIWPPPGFHHRTVQPIASRNTEYAIPTHITYRITLHFKPFLCNSLRPTVRRCIKSENNIYINLIFTLTFLVACLSLFIPLFSYFIILLFHPPIHDYFFLYFLLLCYCLFAPLFVAYFSFLRSSCIAHFCRQTSLFSRLYADSGFAIKCIGTRTVCKSYCLTDCFDTLGNRPGQLIQTQDNSRYI